MGEGMKEGRVGDRKRRRKGRGRKESDQVPWLPAYFSRKPCIR